MKVCVHAVNVLDLKPCGVTMKDSVAKSNQRPRRQVGGEKMRTKGREKMPIEHYAHQEKEMTKTWHSNTTSILVILEAQGMIKNSIDKDLKKMPGNPSIYEIQRNGLRVTAHIEKLSQFNMLHGSL